MMPYRVWGIYTTNPKASLTRGFLGTAPIPEDVLEFLQGANYTTLLALLGGVPKAPEDGETCAMKDGEWVALVLPTP